MPLQEKCSQESLGQTMKPSLCPALRGAGWSWEENSAREEMCLNHQLSCKTLWSFKSVCKCLEVVEQIPGIWAWLLVPAKLTCFHLRCPSGKPLAASLAEPIPHTSRLNPISDKASISTQTPLVGLYQDRWQKEWCKMAHENHVYLLLLQSFIISRMSTLYTL